MGQELMVGLAGVGSGLFGWAGGADGAGAAAAGGVGGVKLSGELRWREGFVAEIEKNELNAAVKKERHSILYILN